MRSIVAVMVFGGLAAIALGAFAPEVVRIAAGAQFSAAAGAVPGLAMATALAGAFFMVGVACSVAGTPAWIAGVAAVTGAGGQIVLTWLALGSIGEQAAVGMGAVGGQAIAIATLTVLAGRKSLSEPWKILALTVLALLEAVGVQLVIASSSTEARWALGATASLLILAAGVLRYSRRNLTEA